MNFKAADLRRQMTSMLQGYLEAFPSEIAGLQQLSDQLIGDTEVVLHRSNMRGHITASALVLDRTFSNVLMINHPLHQRWLQPGGHVEPGCTSIWSAAAEEVTQETGLPAMSPLGKLAVLGIPLDIDTHAIPANPKKAEGSHFHHDFIFMAVAAIDFEPAPQPGDAVKEAKWMPLSELLVLPGARTQRLATKVALVLGEFPEHKPAAPAGPR